MHRPHAFINLIYSGRNRTEWRQILSAVASSSVDHWLIYSSTVGKYINMLALPTLFH